MLATSWPARGADLTPALQWVTSAGGSGNSLVTAAAADDQGNLYIVGSTTSLDFPLIGAMPAPAGASLLTRIDLATASSRRLFPAGLSSISAAAAAPATPGTLYAASASQIWQSADAGSTWTMVSQLASGVSVFGLAVDPVTSTTIYAATATIGVQKSNDGGRSWTGLNKGIPLSNGILSVRNLWIEPAAPNVIFATNSFGLMRSTDGGGAWTPVMPGNAFSVLAFDPFTNGIVYVGSGSDISKSVDNGASFVRQSTLPNQAGVIALLADQHHMGVLYAGTTGGVYQSVDSGGTWILKSPGVTTVLAADPNSETLYASSVFPNSGLRIGASSNEFVNMVPIGPDVPALAQIIVSGPNLFEISAATTDAFAMKLDRNGNIVYSTYFGGSGNDAAVALAVGSDGSLFVTGTTTSADLPVTTSAFLPQLPSGHGGSASFVLKLNPAGTVNWASYFTEPGVAAIAVDRTGNSFVAGSTGGGLPTTPGAYQTDFQQTVLSNIFFSLPGPLSAFVTKFNASGTGLVYSTYVPADNNKNTVQGARALVVDATGNAWLGVPTGSGIAPGTGVSPSVVELNSSGSGLIASAVQAGLGSVAALALDAASNVYIAGSYTPQNVSFPATSGAFQSAPQPVAPTLGSQGGSGGGTEAFVAKWDSGLTHLLAATLLGGELPDVATSVSVDNSGAVIVGGYTDSKAFPTHAPLAAAFSSRSGFVAAFDSNLSNLLFSTYLGDGRPFSAASAVPDGSGNILLAGSTLSTGNTFVGGDNGASFTAGGLVFANKIALTPAPAVRLDSVQNYASHLAQALAPGEPIAVTGAGFGTGAQVVVDGSPLRTISADATSVVAAMPDAAPVSSVHTVHVVSGTTLSNAVYIPAAAASPAIYTTGGDGTGQGYILNSDGTLNSPTNPAATGSAITIFIAGAGQFTLQNGYAVTTQVPAVYIDGFYCNGIAATAGPVNGFPGSVYQLRVFVPDPAVLATNNPDLKNFRFPAQSAIQITMGPGNSLNFANSLMVSQTGVFINIK